VGIATCAAAPNLDEDADRLLAAFSRLGTEPVVGVWDDDTVRWGQLSAVLVRSTWDYPLRHGDFLSWTRSCRRTGNPVDVLAWNTDKRYLQTLAVAGVDTVPTAFADPGQTWLPFGDDFVIKPVVSGSAADTARFDTAHSADADAFVATLHRQGRTVMVQPYLRGIEDTGETSLIYLAGVYSHAVRREPLLTAHGIRQPVTVQDVLSQVVPVNPTDAQRQLAERAMTAVPGGRSRLSYARVDLVPGPTGPMLLELELTDCFLFLQFAQPDAVTAMVSHFLTQS
jgi:hypothetical protein